MRETFRGAGRRVIYGSALYVYADVFKDGMEPAPWVVAFGNRETTTVRRRFRLERKAVAFARGWVRRHEPAPWWGAADVVGYVVEPGTCGLRCPEHGDACPVCVDVLEDRREARGADERISIREHRRAGLHLCLAPARDGGDPHSWEGV